MAPIPATPFTKGVTRALFAAPEEVAAPSPEVVDAAAVAEASEEEAEVVCEANEAHGVTADALYTDVLAICNTFPPSRSRMMPYHKTTAVLALADRAFATADLHGVVVADGVGEVARAPVHVRPSALATGLVSLKARAGPRARFRQCGGRRCGGHGDRARRACHAGSALVKLERFVCRCV